MSTAYFNTIAERRREEAKATAAFDQRARGRSRHSDVRSWKACEDSEDSVDNDLDQSRSNDNLNSPPVTIALHINYQVNTMQ